MLEPEEKATDATSGTTDILQFLRDNKIRYIDKRANGGSLWIIGGWELSDVVAKARSFGYTFRFKKMEAVQLRTVLLGGPSDCCLPERDGFRT